MPIFCLDGSIGCGKTTLLQYIHTHYGIPIDIEPVQKWQPFLERLYKPARRGQRQDGGAFELQTRVWLDRCWIQEKNPNTTILMERSPYFQRQVFLPLSRNKMAVHEYNTLIDMYDRSDKLWQPSGYIYLRSNPRKCLERIRVRQRPSEQNITLQYLNQIHDYHEKAYMQAVAARVPVICIDIDGAPTSKTVQSIAIEVIRALDAFGGLVINS